MRRSSAQWIRFWELVERQHGVIERSQLRELDFSDDEIDARLATGFLHELHRGVYAVGRPGVSDRGRWLAAVLACGPHAALSHTSAAALWGIVSDDEYQTHVSVPATCHPRHPKIKAHRRTPMPVVLVVDGIPVTAPLATLVDIARPRQVWALERAVNEADKLGLVRFDEALECLGEFARRPGVRTLESVLRRHQRTDSGLERRFLKLLRDAGLPRPLTGSIVRGFRVDFYWPELALVVETDGLTYHRTPSQQANDRRRDQTLTAAGITVLRFTNNQVWREPKIVVHTLRTVIRRLTTSAVQKTGE
jgi:very-short-patch-repair endonuclease